MLTISDLDRSRAPPSCSNTGRQLSALLRQEHEFGAGLALAAASTVPALALDSTPHGVEMLQKRVRSGELTLRQYKSLLAGAAPDTTPSSASSHHRTTLPPPLPPSTGGNFAASMLACVAQPLLELQRGLDPRCGGQSWAGQPPAETEAELASAWLREQVRQEVERARRMLRIVLADAVPKVKMCSHLCGVCVCVCGGGGVR
jgi:hypothetical protein